MTPVDMDKWDRREIFNLFSENSNPFYMVTFREDITEVYNFAKKERLSFYHVMIYLVTKAVNSIKNFHYAISNGTVVLIDGRNPSFTDMKHGSELFHIITMPYEEDIYKFCHNAYVKNESQDSFIDYSAETCDLIYFSSLPWLDISAATNAFNWADPHTKDENIPRIIWGKYKENRSGRKELSISVEVNHRFIDGIHIGMFARELERLILELKHAV